MAHRGYYGVDTNADLDPALINRETRPLRLRMYDFISEMGGFMMVVIGVLIIAMPHMQKPLMADLLTVFGLFFIWYAKGKVRKYQFRKPMEKLKNGKTINDGIMFMGNDKANNAGIWFSNDDLRTHMLVFGSTGSGKTRFLLGVLYQAIMIGSGCMYVDGKGDNTVWWLLYSLCRRIGREDDLLVINYLTGGEESSEGTRSLDRISNTNNPCAHGTGEQLRSLIVGLMRESGGDGDMWKGRTSAMLGGVLKALTYMRNKGEINLDVEVIRSFMPLDPIVKLSQRTDISDRALGPIRKYLAELPGYTDEDAMMGQLQPKVYEQHGYLTMQLTEVMADMTDTYGHIFSAPLGEVDFKDVVFNRRILFVMLPALEKDPDALSGLGKLVVAGVRSALAPALGNKIEGTKGEVIDQKPTTSNVPFLMILDEYGYYSVKGFAVVAAQARSLGVGVIFAGQDYPSFKKGSEEEAASTVANTNIKVCMKLEDPKDTFEIMEARGGESDITVTAGHEIKGSAFSGYSDQQTTRLDRRKRINVRDLVRQKPGEAHVMFGDELCRCQLFYANPHQVNEARVNKFLMINKAKKNIIDTINGTFGKLNNLFESKEKEEDKELFDDSLKNIFYDMNLASEHQENLLNSSIVAIGMIEVRDLIIDKKIERAAGISTEKEVEVAKNIAIKPDYKSVNTLPPLMPESFDLEEDDNDSIELSAIGDKEKPLDTVSNEAYELSANFESILNLSVLSNIEKSMDGPMSKKQKEDFSPINQLAQLEALKGATAEFANMEARKGISALSERSTYPQSPTPEKETQEQLQDRINQLLINMGNKTK